MDTHNQTGPLWCWFPSKWACAHSRPLWVSPRTSPMRLGVSPSAAPTPTGVFNQRFEALFSGAGALGCAVCFALRRLPGLSVCECGASGSASGQTACPVCPTLHQSLSGSCQGNASPLCPGCPSLPLLPVWVNVSFLSTWCQTSLLFDFLSVLVVRGGAVSLPTPPSWFQVHRNLMAEDFITLCFTKRISFFLRPKAPFLVFSLYLFPKL